MNESGSKLVTNSVTDVILRQMQTMKVGVYPYWISVLCYLSRIKNVAYISTCHTNCECDRSRLNGPRWHCRQSSLITDTDTSVEKLGGGGGGRGGGDATYSWKQSSADNEWQWQFFGSCRLWPYFSVCKRESLQNHGVLLLASNRVYPRYLTHVIRDRQFKKEEDRIIKCSLSRFERTTKNRGLLEACETG